jgi:hypothetical protein
VGLLALTPLRLGFLVCVAVRKHDARHVVAEGATDLLETFGSAAVLHEVVQKRGDGFVFSGVHLQRQAGDGQEVGHVGRSSARSKRSLCRGVSVQLLGMRYTWPTECLLAPDEA